LVNLSVWQSVETLRAFTYSGPHSDFMRRRAEWFEPHAGPYLVMWWIEEGDIPTVQEAIERLQHLADHGPTGHAFTFAFRQAAAKT
jgi:hypothetical protein